MEIREIFYVTASIALILISLTIIALFYLLFRLKQVLDLGLKRVNAVASEISHQSSVVAKTWGRVAAARLVIRILKLIF